MLSKIIEKIKSIGPTLPRWIVVVSVLVVWATMYIAWLDEERHLKLLFPSLYPRTSYDIRNDIIGVLVAGIPGLIAILLLFTLKVRSTAQSILKGITLAFLVVAPLWSKGYLWIAIIGPFLYAIGAAILSLIEVLQKKRQAAASEIGEETGKVNSAQWWLVALIVAFTIGAFLYRLLMHQGLGHSAAMFLGIPAVLGILLALTPKAKTVTGGILKGITLALLIVAPLLGEGYLCILMASPLFYLVGIAIGLIVDSVRKRRGATVSCIAVALLPMCCEGIVPQLAWNRAQSVEVTQVIAAPPEAVQTALAHSPSVQSPLPLFLRIGFPRPLEAHGYGLDPGAMRTIHFAGAEGDPPGDLVMRVAESRPGYVRFASVSDTSKLTQWLRWDGSEVSWSRIDREHTRVTWKIHFERELDPAWYFAPWERFAVHEAARFLIEAGATPSGAVR
jgi:hypothetical protein